MDKRVEKIKEYLDRISRGEDFDRIRTEFVRDFQDVDSNEIMRAEQKFWRKERQWKNYKSSVMCIWHSFMSERQKWIRWKS